MPRLVAIALDLGSTAIKAGLFDVSGELHRVVSRPAPVLNIEDERCEGDALAYVAVAEAVLADCLAQTDERPPLGLCCQRSSFLLWERATGRPVTPLISWQDARGASACAALDERAGEIRALTGLPLTPYYLGPKLRVLLAEHPHWQAHLQSGAWLLGTLDSFVIWRWSGVHMIDASMAARTLLMDVHHGQWSARLCDLCGVPVAALPEIRPSCGWTLPLRNGLTLRASVADQSAALYASFSGECGEVMINLGTGGFALLPLPREQAVPPGYLQTLLWKDEDGMRFAAEGTLNSIAAALAPYPAAACRIENLAHDVIYCLPEPSGLGAPYFRQGIGLTFSAPVAGLVPQRIAALLIEGIAFRVVRMLEDWQAEFGVHRVRLAGGLSNLPALREAIVQCAPFAEVWHCAQTEASLAGAARLASGWEVSAMQGARVAGKNPRLCEKYAHWKAWLDDLLLVDEKKAFFV